MSRLERYVRVFASIVNVVDTIISSSPRRHCDVSEKSPRDLVSAVDLALAVEIKRVILAEFPHDEIVCEEPAGCRPQIKIPPHRWIVDPLDGTTNYVCGFPFFATAVSCHQGESDEPIASLVYAPLLNQRFQAFKDEQATLNGSSIATSRTADVHSSLILTGFPSNVAAHDPSLRVFADASSSSRGTRRSGSAAIDICWVAAGFADAYYHFSLSPWEFMAATHILRNAGGRATNLGSSSLSVTDRTILASNSACHDSWNSFLLEAQARAA